MKMGYMLMLGLLAVVGIIMYRRVSQGPGVSLWPTFTSGGGGFSANPRANSPITVPDTSFWSTLNDATKTFKGATEVARTIGDIFGPRTDNPMDISPM